MTASVARLMVTFNSAKALREIALHEPLRLFTMVVDNASTDDTCAVASSLGCAVLNLSVNQGYGRAIMLGLEVMDSEFILITNPDAEVQQSAVDALLDAAHRYPECDLFAPSLAHSDGRPFFRFDSKFDPICRNRMIPTGEACIKIMSGAAFMVRRTSFLMHGFDPNIFLYFEDDELGLSYARSRLPIIYIPSAVIRHVGNSSSMYSQEIEDSKARSFGWSWGYVMAKHSVGSLGHAKLSTRLKLISALLSFRMRSFRRQALILSGLRLFEQGYKAPNLP